MKKFTIYNSDGEILRVGTCSDRDFLLQAQADEFVIEGFANQETQKVVNDKIVDKNE